ncbi:MAG: TetR/AcrR family transcriptional regulator [Elusimicrobia bacterium]|nr:TetR/AcrR family transcriptional regulator [Elusimicrobiota bacterium]
MPITETNKDVILSAAAELFLRRGFHGTSTRDIAEKAGVSLGNIYNHFKTKEEVFATLLARYEAQYFQPGHPLYRVLSETPFPDNIEKIASASRESVERFREYILLIYVDVVEFDAKHIARLFGSMRSRYSELLSRGNGGKPPALAPGVDPSTALMLVTWSFFNYFIMEKLFGVRGHYGLADDDVVKQFAAIFRNGILPSPRPSPASGRGKGAGNRRKR